MTLNDLEIALRQNMWLGEILERFEEIVYAAGDIARWPDRLTGEPSRVEHWVVAERQGQTAARNILGARERFDTVPFFWTQQHDLLLNYVGYAPQWDRIDIDGRLEARDCMATLDDSFIGLILICSITECRAGAARFFRGGEMLKLSIFSRR